MEINSRNFAITVGTDAVLVSEEKVLASERVRLVLSNTSTGGQKISVSVGADPSSGLGIPLSPGGSMEWERQSSIPVSQKRVLAISDIAGGSLSIYEEVLQ